MMNWTATNSEGYPAPVALATDIVLLTVAEQQLRALVITREEGIRALPGGFVGPAESPRQTAERKLREKTGLRSLYLEQLAAFAEPERDPRGWIPSIAYMALVPPGTHPTDSQAGWVPAHGRHRLAFDHRAILRHAVDRLEGKLWWSNIAVGILPRPFTLSLARHVYEGIARTSYDPPTFARDLKATGLVEPTGEMYAEGPGRPAALYRFTTRRPQWGAGHRKRVG